ncbi:MAG: hypothetical protein UV61_C0010G0002 [Candidatus Gottesmanbacteria bacterium GW2011_GWB1_43_11]|uniref:Double zinc ribbon domain-containing protein n=1 Tax=Candidatus Gottesmanbacteria bacterium GW2011_GWB1_43_11 TaxID=1618446 RepID=A0A0G1ETN3_9BACT|nr:MAG: hypothetical protein UV04_C0012G0002 [Candidatus Gottesmanbacteria bacterium GW2011_GWA2_42_16]KKS53517.1 MAG: hypothetical protein UV17_C0035G0002 [Candidatus Gottesmanbacteria bacterium GW2011_GWA1_42_26]KKS81192.1 MAG: hypothetical protein UV55_C0018G0002 [Candidatus Gottesmanbacteria bacterium GW2011_GWC1_43_10]KKS86451.1 MAG: hypothetical protein UV61_C0010G0002 [Candidatus Gottesmanbacteria bacterium GW2011_GWB1_43_11]
MNFLDLIFPRRCLGCNRLGSYICNACRTTLDLRGQRCPECDRPAIDGMTHPICLRPLGLDGLVTVFENRGIIKKAIKSLKYRFVYDAAEELVNLVPDSALQNLPIKSNSWALYPIPLHKDRLRWRGFNQAEKLGQFVAQRLKMKMIDGLLVRTVKRTPQADISRREDRIQNAQGLFQLNKLSTSNLPAGRQGSQLSILLFDDVWTTGATMKEAVKVLKRSGLGKVWGMTLAR